MATTRKTVKRKEKTIDLPPKGPRNRDPISGASGAHPIETGVGAALGGAAAGLAVGAVGGPVGAVIGAAVGGALAGGLAGKGVGELIDPTTEDQWLREYHGSQSHHKKGETHERYREAYRFGISAFDRYGGRRFEEVEPELQADWDCLSSTSSLAWKDARGAVRHAYERTAELRHHRNI